MSSSRATKRNRRDGASTSRRGPEVITEITPLTPIEEVRGSDMYRGNLVFAPDTDQEERYRILASRTLVNCRWVSPEMDRLGIREPVEALFRSLGWDRLLDTNERTYTRITLEFLSSLTKHFPKDGDASKPGAISPHIKFRLLNQDYLLTLEQLSEIFGVPTGDHTKMYSIEYSYSEYTWNLIGSDEYSPHDSKASHIRHPAIRYFQQWMARSIFGRYHAGGVTTSDLIYIHMALEHLIGLRRLPPAFRRVSVAALIVQQMDRVARQRANTNAGLAVGGMITMIARRLGINVGMFSDPVKGSTRLDLEALRQKHYGYAQDDYFIWRFVDIRGTAQEIQLTPELTRLQSEDDARFTPDPSTCLRDSETMRRLRPLKRRPIDRGEPSTTEPMYPTSQPPPTVESESFEQRMFARLDNMGYRMEDMYEGITQCMTSMDIRMNGLDMRMSGVESQMGGLYDRFDYVMESMHRMNQNHAEQYHQAPVPIPEWYQAPWYTGPHPPMGGHVGEEGQVDEERNEEAARENPMGDPRDPMSPHED